MHFLFIDYDSLNVGSSAFMEISRLYLQLLTFSKIQFS